MLSPYYPFRKTSFNDTPTISTSTWPFSGRTCNSETVHSLSCPWRAFLTGIYKFGGRQTSRSGFLEQKKVGVVWGRRCQKEVKGQFCSLLYSDSFLEESHFFLIYLRIPSERHEKELTRNVSCWRREVGNLGSFRLSSSPKLHAYCCSQ